MTMLKILIASFLLFSLEGCTSFKFEIIPAEIHTPSSNEVYLNEISYT